MPKFPTFKEDTALRITQDRSNVVSPREAQEAEMEAARAVEAIGQLSQRWKRLKDTESKVEQEHAREYIRKKIGEYQEDLQLDPEKASNEYNVREGLIRDLQSTYRAYRDTYKNPEKLQEIFNVIDKEVGTYLNTKGFAETLDRKEARVKHLAVDFSKKAVDKVSKTGFSAASYMDEALRYRELLVEIGATEKEQQGAIRTFRRDYFRAGYFKLNSDIRTVGKQTEDFVEKYGTEFGYTNEEKKQLIDATYTTKENMLKRSTVDLVHKQKVRRLNKLEKDHSVLMGLTRALKKREEEGKPITNEDVQEVYEVLSRIRHLMTTEGFNLVNSLVGNLGKATTDGYMQKIAQQIYLGAFDTLADLQSNLASELGGNIIGPSEASKLITMWKSLNPASTDDKSQRREILNIATGVLFGDGATYKELQDGTFVLVPREEAADAFMRFRLSVASHFDAGKDKSIEGYSKAVLKAVYDNSPDKAGELNSLLEADIIKGGSLFKQIDGYVKVINNVEAPSVDRKRALKVLLDNLTSLRNRVIELRERGKTLTGAEKRINDNQIRTLTVRRQTITNLIKAARRRQESKKQIESVEGKLNIGK